MPPKKDNLPINVDVDLENGGTITYANEVIAIIAGVATSEIDGIAGMCASGGVGDIFGRNRNITRGVKVEIGSEEASVDLYIIVEYGQPIQKVASEVQENVRKAIESMTGLHVVRVDVHVQGVSFEKEKRETQTSIDAAAEKPALAESDAQEHAAPKEDEAAQPEEDTAAFPGYTQEEIDKLQQEAEMYCGLDEPVAEEQPEAAEPEEPEEQEAAEQAPVEDSEVECAPVETAEPAEDAEPEQPQQDQQGDDEEAPDPQEPEASAPKKRRRRG